MWWLLVGRVLAQEPDPCHFEKPVSIGELHDAMMTCQLPVGSVISVSVEEVTPTESKPGIGFHSNDSALNDSGKSALDVVAAVLMIRKKMNIKVIGYADRSEQGDLLDLSLRRAQVASGYLVTKGIDMKRVSIEAAGADKPIDTTDTAEGHARNRRVEFVLSATQSVQ